MADVAGCYEDVPETSFVSQPGTVGNVLDIGEGFGVGVGNAWTTVFLAEGDEGLRGYLIMIDVGG